MPIHKKTISSDTRDPGVRIRLLDLSVIAFAGLALLIFFVMTFRSNEFVNVTIRVTDTNPIWDYNDPPAWYVNALKKGMQEKDGLGRVQSEIKEIRSYPMQPTNFFAAGRKTVYVQLAVKAVYSKTKGTYAYRGKPLILGSPIKIELQNQAIEGIITEVEHSPVAFTEKELEVTATLRNNRPEIFRETDGVDRYIADAIHEGDTVSDVDGKPIITVVKKVVVPAKHLVTTVYGDILSGEDPERVTVTLTLRLHVKEINGEYYSMDKVRVAINELIPIDLKRILIYPYILTIKEL